MQVILILLGGSVLIPLVLAVSAISSGIVIQYLWLWFVVPLGIAHITIAHSIGLGMIASFVTYQQIDAEPEKSDSNAKLGKAVGFVLLRPVLVFLVAWVVQLFM